MNESRRIWLFIVLFSFIVFFTLCRILYVSDFAFHSVRRPSKYVDPSKIVFVSSWLQTHATEIDSICMDCATQTLLQASITRDYLENHLGDQFSAMDSNSVYRVQLDISGIVTNEISKKNVHTFNPSSVSENEFVALGHAYDICRKYDIVGYDMRQMSFYYVLIVTNDLTCEYELIVTHVNTPARFVNMFAHLCESKVDHRGDVYVKSGTNIYIHSERR